MESTKEVAMKEFADKLDAIMDDRLCVIVEYRDDVPYRVRATTPNRGDVWYMLHPHADDSDLRLWSCSPDGDWGEILNP